jgi:hypothetical protein
MSKRTIVKNFISMIENGKINDAFFSENLVVEGIKPMPMNKEQYVEYLDKLVTSVPDISYNCKEIKASRGDVVTAKVKISGTNTQPFDIPDIPTHPATGKSFKLPVETIEYELVGNRISKIRLNGSRTTELMNQLGINPY